MSKIFKNFTWLLSILLFTSGLNLHANSEFENSNNNILETYLNTCNAHVNSYSNVLIFHSSNEENQRYIPFEIPEVLEIENEESSGESAFLSYFPQTAHVLNAQLFNELAFKLHQVLLNHHKNYFDKSATKLHVRLQVFII
ncbi:hypothetical protein [Litoribaculum gwangyangense]|uniref:Uncharacterized protein n=1 Tax=Litoribaculum gwangyangense TaxID=1130722 RepID=A0ABP9C1B9_9FLAO